MSFAANRQEAKAMLADIKVVPARPTKSMSAPLTYHHRYEDDASRAADHRLAPLESPRKDPRPEVNSTVPASSPPPPLAHACEDHWSWNNKDRSDEVRLSGPKNRIAHFHPNWSNGTAGVRGTRVLNGGRYYWEVNVSQRIFGTSMMFGVGTASCRLHVDAFVNMLGENGHSWGLSHKGYLWHADKSKAYTQPFRENVETTIGIFFDGINGTLTYYKDGVSLGVAFTGLHEVAEALYPVVCSTAAKTEMALGVMRRDYLSLQDRCRAVVLRHLTREEHIDRLRLPRMLKQFIAEGLEDFRADLALAQNNNERFNFTHY